MLGGAVHCRAAPLRIVVVALLAILLGGCDWLGYLGGPDHASVSNDTGIAKDAIASLSQRWRWPLPSVAGRDRRVLATPATWQGTIYVPGDTGVLYALSEADKSVRWKRDFGVVPELHCKDAQGIVASPAIRADHGHPYVYVNAPDGYLYELDGTTGKTIWRSVVQIPSPTVNDVFPWSSPTLFDGKVYVGISSNCDNPFVRGGVKSYNALTGAPIATAWTIPDGFLGAGVWSSVAADTSGVYATTASVLPSTQNAHPPTPTNDFDQYSIMKFDPNTLAVTGKWVAPPTTTIDPDFASSPVLFDANIGGTSTPMVGACRKDGYFYALRADTMQLVWSLQVMNGTPSGQQNCIGGGIWDGTHLYLAGGGTQIDGVGYSGSVREVDPATGGIVWALGLPAVPLAPGTYNRNGILAYSTAHWISPAGNAVYLVDAATGTVLRTLTDSSGAASFSQPIWVDGQLFATNFSAVVDWQPPPAPH